MRIIQRLRMPGLLSFPPDMDFFDLQSLNVLIGPNASGKSNFIEVLGLLSALPTDFAAAIRDGGGAAEWVWKGSARLSPATIEVETTSPYYPPLRYRLSFFPMGPGVAISDETVEGIHPEPGHEPDFYYTLQQGRPAINIRVRTQDGQEERSLKWDMRTLDQSVLAQRKDPDLYPELYWFGVVLGTMQSFREWTFGRYGELRGPQRADLPATWLLPDCSNLALVLNHIEHKLGPTFDEHVRRFFPRFKRMTTTVSGGTVQFYLHESDFGKPIPATRLSDGTIRFIALLATLLTPDPQGLPIPARVVCIEEPELGLHPDAVAMLADLLVEASERMQLVVTTHSDALVSALTNQPDAIVACERPGAGTELRRLDPERLASWLEDYRLGDLWRMGELGANP
ncbi:MAG: AAA family ATPase [Acidobacteria bacterium]|nr:AAA family ATPase [Acidobacteriota bacterium]